MWPTPLHPGVGHPCPEAANKSLEPDIHKHKIMPFQNTSLKTETIAEP